ncbi:MAG: DUF2029 domain-containing protein [Herpetosiphonaceae bacterium]|nr:DUF2029 domain-containing protein [Herpetosiphonaceae bacterium]
MQPHALPRLSDLPRPLLTIIILNLTLGICYLGFLAKVARDGDLWRADFTSFYTGWSMVLEGEGERLYDLELQQDYQQRILVGRNFKDGLLPYVNPPHSTLPFVPLALLSRTQAHIVWMVLNAGLLIYLIRRALYVVRDWSTLERWALVSSIVAFPALYTSFLVGAFSLLVTAALLNCYIALEEGRDRQAACWLFLATVKFQLVLLPALWLFGARRWRAVLWGLGLTMSAIILTGLLFGWQVWADYVEVLRVHNQAYNYRGMFPEETYSLKGALALLFGQPAYSPIVAITTAIFVGAGASALWLGQRDRQGSATGRALSFGLASVLGLAFNLHLYLHDLLLVLVPGMLFFLYLRRSGLPTRRYATFALLAPLVAFGAEMTLQTRLGIQIPVILLFILLGWMVRAYAAGTGGQQPVPAPPPDA